MKRRIQQANSAKEKATMAPAVPPTVEEIRQRAQEIFLARGGTPGKELDDWLRAEQELKQERAGAETGPNQQILGGPQYEARRQPGE
jgi:hypothetical protein